MEKKSRFVREGFTMVELMAILVIIGLLAAVLAIFAVSFGNFQAGALGDVVELHRQDTKNHDTRIREMEQTMPVVIERLDGIQKSVNHIAEDVKEIRKGQE